MKGFLYGKTEYSILSSTNRLDEYISYAKANHLDFLSITDPNMYGAYKFYTKCMENDIKPIMGLEYTYSLDLKKSKVLLYAKSNLGFKYLLKIASKVNIEGSDGLDLLDKYKDELIIIFVYNNSYLEELYSDSDKNLFLSHLARINNLGGYVGLSYTNYPTKYMETKNVRMYLENTNVKIIDIHECKYLKKEDYKVYEALRKIDLSDDFNPGYDFSFPDIIEESDLLDEIISDIKLDLFKEKINLPVFPNKFNVNSKEALHGLCKKGLEKRGYKNNKRYQDRLEYELNIISKMGYDDYFLIVWDFIKYAKQNDILVGPGRGSAAGSLVAYTLGITDVNPMDYDLLFERFLNPERVSMPDIDTDFPDDKRDLVINYVKELYGSMHVSNITAFGTFKFRSSIRDLARIEGYSKNITDTLVDTIEKYGFDYLINEKREEDPNLVNLLQIAKGIEDLPRNISTHAAGIILSDRDLTDIVPLTNGINGLYQAQFEASDLEKIGLLKMDFLGIRNLTMVKGMMDLLPGFNRSKLLSIPLNDMKVYKMLQSGDTLGIFQLESAGIRRVLMDLKPTDFNDLVAVLALYRPGPMDNIPDYIRRKHGERIEYLDNDLIPILKGTYGVIVYQEQIMQIAQRFAGFSLGEADLLRRAVSKKDPEKLKKLKDEFVKRSVEKGYKVEVANSIYELIYKFANYGFNKSHSVAYAMLSYQMAWFKANYFSIFMANLLNDTIQAKDKLVSYIRYAKAHRMTIVGPDINISLNKFVYQNNKLYMPLLSIFSLGAVSSNNIIEERSKAPFESFDDFKERCSFLSKANIDALAFSGAFDSFNITKAEITSGVNQNPAFGGFINQKEIEEFSFEYLAEKEKEYLGINLKYNLFTNLNHLYKSFNAVYINNLKYNIFTNVVCAFNKINVIQTKAKQESMLVGNIYDSDSEIQVVCFPSAYSNLKYIPPLNKVCVVRGILKKDNKNQDSFSIYEIYEVK